MHRFGSAGSAILPPLQGISVNNAPRGQKRGLSAEREENATKWQSLCSAPWSLVFEGAVDSLARQMRLSDESAVPPKEIRYQHEFCWGDKRMGTLNPDMMFIVKGRRITIAGQYKYVLIPGLRISGVSQNNWLWQNMVEAFGPYSVSRTVACSDSTTLLKGHLYPFLGAWVQFFARNFETSI
jgi:hypothetical protein